MAEFYEAASIFEYFCAVCSSSDFCEKPEECEILRGLSDLPSIDITYCKDCRYHDCLCSAPEYDCPFWPSEKYISGYGFCHMGQERRQ